MKSRIFGVITLLSMTLAGGALACPVGVGDRVTPLPRPVVQNVSLQASELIERAGRVESAASAHEQSARAFEQEANLLASRARMLRNEAALVDASDRLSLVTLADELSQRAMRHRSRAADHRAQARELRLEARALRDRAFTLVRGGGGGWRTRPALPEATPLPAERSVTL